MVKKIIFLFYICFLLSACSGPWEDLSDLYEISEAPKSNKTTQSTNTVVLSGSNHKGAQTFRGIVIGSFEDSGVYLSLESPYSWIHKDLYIPLSAITACSRTQWSSGWDTNLWIDEAHVEIAFPDNEQTVLNWCLKSNIRLINREEARKALHNEAKSTLALPASNFS